MATMDDKEYIERAALEKEIDEAQNELTSNDDRTWEMNRKYFKGLAWARRLLLDAPAADVVEVVRCEKCKHYMPEESVCVPPNFDCHGYCDAWLNVKPDDFCSYGERKE